MAHIGFHVRVGEAGSWFDGRVYGLYEGTEKKMETPIVLYRV